MVSSDFDRWWLPMSELLKLNHRIQDTSSVIAKLELALAKHPDSTALRLNLESAWKKFNQLQAEFYEFTNLQKMRKRPDL